MESVYLDYATGALSPPARLLVDTHLAMRPERRADVAVWEAVGAQLLEAEAAPLSDDARERAQQRLDGAAMAPSTPLSPAPDGLPIPSRAAAIASASTEGSPM